MVMALWCAVIVLAYANGANDNFKGVATLFGSRTMSYRQALSWATVTTFAGSMTALLLARGLVSVFSGTGLLSERVAGSSPFLLAVALGAALTVIIATGTGLPISTTHALTGALVGAGFVAAGSVNLSQLGHRFVLPLATSPFMSLGITGVLYPIFRRIRRALGVERQMCLCVDGGVWQPITATSSGAAALQASGMTLSVGQLRQCAERYHGRVLGIDAQHILDRIHLVSAGAVSFARGLNDTPKIAAMLIAAKALHVPLPAALLLTAIAMALGGLLNARRIAATMSERITAMNHGQGFTANLTTSLLVLVASRFGLPVSTTHVACGSLFGLGAVTGQARWTMIRTIVTAWLGTLPVAACLAALTYRIIA
ncbi:MAG: inorganic phosphate transporter [Candidatus Omnitrophica bacterium]|nr:inorganic phosphate transporter [Candidatus Omnitrophota bacterium]